jgi:lysophospholipase L1-like esterase
LSPTQTCGTYFTLDGVHPSGLSHQAIANLMIDSVNAKYGTSVPNVP